MKWLKKWWWLWLIVIFAFGIRTFELDRIPAGLYYDEIDLGYQVRSLIETGKDYRGHLSPFFVRSFNTDKEPLPVYWSFIGQLWKDPVIQVRMPTAVMGTLAVLLLMLIVWGWSKSKLATVLVGLVAATNPWLIHFSRISFEAIYSLSIFLLFVYYWQRWVKNKKVWQFYLSLAILGLGVYTYRIMSLYVPLTVVLLWIIYWKNLRELPIKQLLMGGLILVALVTPFLLATTLGSEDEPRIAQISVAADSMTPIRVQRAREIDSGDYKTKELGNRAILSSFIFHNKYLDWLGQVKSNYLANWSTEYLFIRGDPSLRQSVGGMGEFLLIDILGLGVGLLYLVKNFRKRIEMRWLAAWLLTAPIPADLTIDGASHASRMILMVGPLLIIVGLGRWRKIGWLVKINWGKSVIIGLTGLWLISFVFYSHRYLIHFPMEAARYHGYGYEQMTKAVLREQKDYNKIYLTYSYDPPMLYFLFWANIPPKQVQEYGSEFGTEVIKSQPLDKFKVMDWARLTDHKDIPKQLGEVLEPNILYVLTQSDVSLDFQPPKTTIPAGVKVVDIVYFPDNNEVAFYLLTGEKGFKAKGQSDKPQR